MRIFFSIFTILICVAISVLFTQFSGITGHGPNFSTFIFAIAFFGNVIFLGFYGLTSRELNTEIKLHQYVKVLCGMNLAIAVIEYIGLKNENSLQLEIYSFFIASQCFTFFMAFAPIRAKINDIRRIERTAAAKNDPPA